MKAPLHTLWRHDGHLRSLVMCSHDQSKILAKQAELEAAGTKTWLEVTEPLRYPVYLFETWDEVSKQNTFTILTEARMLLRLRAIHSGLSTDDGDEEDLPYVVYPIANDITVERGMGELLHHHLTRTLVEDRTSRWWLPRPKVSFPCRTHDVINCPSSDCKEIARLRWALARIKVTAEEVINQQYDKALKGCRDIAAEALDEEG